MRDKARGEEEGGGGRGRRGGRRGRKGGASFYIYLVE